MFLFIFIFSFFGFFSFFRRPSRHQNQGSHNAIKNNSARIKERQNRNSGTNIARCIHFCRTDARLHVRCLPARCFLYIAIGIECVINPPLAEVLNSDSTSISSQQGEGRGRSGKQKSGQLKRCPVLLRIERWPFWSPVSSPVTPLTFINVNIRP